MSDQDPAEEAAAELSDYEPVEVLSSELIKESLS